MLGGIIDSCFQRAQELKQATGHIVLERGFATIPLPGIDVPFHSRYLWAGVMPFRACNTGIFFYLIHTYILCARSFKENQRHTNQYRCAD